MKMNSIYYIYNWLGYINILKMFITFYKKSNSLHGIILFEFYIFENSFDLENLSLVNLVNMEWIWNKKERKKINFQVFLKDVS